MKKFEVTSDSNHQNVGQTSEIAEKANVEQQPGENLSSIAEKQEETSYENN